MNLKPPLPKEDYTLEENNGISTTTVTMVRVHQTPLSLCYINTKPVLNFIQNPQQPLIPRAHLDLLDGSGKKRRLQEVTSTPDSQSTDQIKNLHRNQLTSQPVIKQPTITDLQWFVCLFFQFPSLSQRLQGNGVSEERPMVQVKNWRHSVAEDVSETYLMVEPWSEVQQ